VTSDRLEAFSDGVIAILITIMVLELRPPHGSHLSDLGPVLPKVAAYLLSFVLVGIYWNNHHHLFHVVERIDGAVLWSNLALLFSLSLVAFATAWFGDHPTASGPIFWYAAVQVLCAFSYFLLTRALLRIHDGTSPLAVALGADRKGTLSLVAYLCALPLSQVAWWLGVAIIAAVAIVWLVPDRRISRVVG
jgi:uncharacterized membrane protein